MRKMRRADVLVRPARLYGCSFREQIMRPALNENDQENWILEQYRREKAAWKPRKPWVEIRDNGEFDKVYCAEVWCEISPSLLLEWAGNKEYASWLFT